MGPPRADRAARAGCAEEIGGPHRARRRGLDARQTLLLRAADEIHDDGEIGDALWAALASEFDEERLIELCLLVGHYEMLAATLKSLRVQRDPPRSRL